MSAKKENPDDVKTYTGSPTEKLSSISVEGQNKANLWVQNAKCRILIGIWCPEYHNHCNIIAVTSQAGLIQLRPSCLHLF